MVFGGDHEILRHETTLLYKVKRIRFGRDMLDIVQVTGSIVEIRIDSSIVEEENISPHVRHGRTGREAEQLLGKAPDELVPVAILDGVL